MNNDQVDPDKESFNLKKFLGESAVFIAIVTAILYFVGSGYYESFFNRLSIPLKFINIQMIDYMITGIIPILLLGLFVAHFFHVWSREPRNRWEAFEGNLCIIILAILLLVSTILYKNHMFILPTRIIAVSSILMFIYKIYKNESEAYEIYQSSWFTKLTYLIALILALYIIAGFIGNHDAENLIQGQDNTLEVQLSLKDKADTQFQNKTFIFVMQLDNSYYIIEKNETIPEYPKLYIIPTDQVAVATIHRVNS